MFETLKKLHRAYNNHVNYRKAVDELSRLSDRDLSDLGISRCDIKRVARSANR
jgi:uncharacterized protein YjiS (DUF1127 family)